MGGFKRIERLVFKSTVELLKAGIVNPSKECLSGTEQA